MQKGKSLQAQVAGAIAILTLFGTSAFAESRHPQETRGWSVRSFGRAAAAPWSGRSASAFPSRGPMATPEPRFESRGFAPRFESRSRTAGRGGSPRFESRGVSPARFGSPSATARRGGSPRFESRRFSAPRFESRSAAGWRGGAPPRGGRGFDRGVGLRGNAFSNSGRRFMGQGQIRRIVPYRGGYRVFLDGWRYPYFIPFHRFR